MRPAGDPLAGRHQGPRGPRPVPPLHRHRPDDPRLLRRGDAGGGGRLPADAAARGVDALLDAAEAPTTKQTQYYEMLGTRGIWHQGWKAVTEHGPVPIGLGRFDQDRWQLFHTDTDRAEAHDLADQHPDKVEELKALWLEEARKYDVLPLNDLSIRVPGPRVRGCRAGQWQRTPLPGHLGGARGVGGQHHQRLLQDPGRGRVHADSQGVIFAQGSRFGLLAVRQGREADLRLQLPRHPARATAGRRRADLRDPHRRRRVHQGARGRAPRALRADEAPRRRLGRGRAGVPDDRVALQPSRRGPLHRLRRGRRGLQQVQAQVRAHRRQDRQGRLRRRRRRLRGPQLPPPRGHGAD